MAFVFRVKRRVGGKVVTGRVWYVRYRDPQTHKLVTRAGYEDKVATQQLAARLVKEAARHAEGLGPPAAVRQTAETLAELLGRFEAYLADRGRTAKHVAMRLSHCRRAAESLGWLTARDLDPDAAQRLLAQMRVGSKPISERTAAHWVTSLRAFGKWLVKAKAIPANPLVDLVAPPVAVMPHPRRTLSASELSALLQATAAGPERAGLDGPSRAMLYRVASGTGLRREELASLTAASFDLAEKPPRVTLAAADEKAKRGATLPLAPALAKALRKWIAGRVGPLWPGTWCAFGRTVKMLRADLAAAGIEYRTPAGFFDFHALRTQYISDLARAGVSLQVAQRLARHSDPRLTSTIYTRLSIDDLAEAVGKMEAHTSSHT